MEKSIEEHVQLELHKYIIGINNFLRRLSYIYYKQGESSIPDYNYDLLFKEVEKLGEKLEFCTIPKLDEVDYPYVGKFPELGKEELNYSEKILLELSKKNYFLTICILRVCDYTAMYNYVYWNALKGEKIVKRTPEMNTLQLKLTLGAGAIKDDVIYIRDEILLG